MHAESICPLSLSSLSISPFGARAVGDKFEAAEKQSLHPIIDTVVVLVLRSTWSCIYSVVILVDIFISRGGGGL